MVCEVSSILQILHSGNEEKKFNFKFYLVFGIKLQKLLRLSLIIKFGQLAAASIVR